MTRAEMNWKIFRSVLPLVALVAFAYYTQNLNVDYFDSEPVLKTDADDLIWRFQVNEGDLLINKVVQINGKVTKKDSSSIVLNHRIICILDSQKVYSTLDKFITLKGRCVSFNSSKDKLLLDHIVQIMN